MGQTTSNINSTLTTREAEDTNILDILQLIDYGGESYSEMIVSDDFVTMNDNFYRYISSMKVITRSLSVTTIIFDLLLILHLAFDMDNRWQFFPIFIQTVSDIIGPGIANIFHDPIAGLRKQLSEVSVTTSELFNRVSLKGLWMFIDLESGWECLSTYLRFYLNEFCIASCVCATAGIRYVYVCHPAFELKPKSFIKIAITVSATVLLAMRAITLEFNFNNQLDIQRWFEDKLPVTRFYSFLKRAARTEMTYL